MVRPGQLDRLNAPLEAAEDLADKLPAGGKRRRLLPGGHLSRLLGRTLPDGLRRPRPLARWVREACARAGLEGLTFHDLRHVFGSYAARRGIPSPDLAKILGHASIQMTMRYARHAPGDVAQRAAALLDGDA